MAEGTKETVDAGFDSAAFLKTLTSRPGVYRMIDKDDTVIYVGKAKNLKNEYPVIFEKRGLHLKRE